MSQQSLPNLDWALLDRIRDTIREVEPDARIILYGSRARGDADPESDWDLLVLLDGPVDRRREEVVHRQLLALMLETNTALSAVVHDRDEWNTSPHYRAMPFHANVMRDGILLDHLAKPSPSRSVAGDLAPISEDDLMQGREELIRYGMDRAKETIGEAELLAQSGYWNACVNRLYYACFYAVTALLLRHGLSSTKHTGVQSLLNQHFRRTGLIEPDLGDLYNTLFTRRLAGDYKEFVRYREEQVRPWLAQTPRFVARIEELLRAPASEEGDG